MPRATIRLSVAGTIVAVALVSGASPSAAERARSVTPTCHGMPATIVGTNGRDILFGTEGPDVIVGRAGADSIHGGGGDDTICAGSGIYDFVRGGSGDDYVTHIAENPSIKVRLHGGLGNDILVSTSTQSDPLAYGATLYGDDGDDVLRSRTSSDALVGGNGSDQTRGGRGEDLVWDVFTHSSLQSISIDPDLRDSVQIDLPDTEPVTVATDMSTGAFSFPDLGVGLSIGLFEIVTIRTLNDAEWPGPGKWTLTGTDGSDEVHSILGLALDADMGGGDDVVTGSAWDDLINGGPGNDVANGNLGNDTCVDVEAPSNCEILP